MGRYGLGLAFTSHMENMKKDGEVKFNVINRENMNKKPEQASILKKVGDAIELAGDKIEHSGFKGAKTLGDAIEKLGDKVEHARDFNKNKSGKNESAA